MKLTMQYDDNEPMLIVESDGEGRYKISGDRQLPRQDGGTEYETEDGLHVIGLINLIFGANDSREYLHRRLKERDEEVNLHS